MDIDENADQDDLIGVNAVSLVTDPAIDSGWVELSKEAVEACLSIDSDKQIVTGQLLIPDKLILRKRTDGEYYYQRYSAQLIEKVAHRMMRKGDAVIHNTTKQHKEQLDGNYLTELWLVEDPEKDKSKALGIDVPKGTLMASYKIEDHELWENEIKNGKLRGFSIEGFFYEKPTEDEINKNKNDIKMAKTKLFDKIAAIFDSPELETELSAIESVEKLTAELEAAKAKEVELQETIDGLNQGKEADDKEKTDKDALIEQLKAEIEELKAKLAEKETADVAKDEKLSALEAQITELSKEPSATAVNVNNSKTDKPLTGHAKMAAALADILK